MATAPFVPLTAQQRYSTVAIWLHWIIAALVIANLLIGLFHEDFSKPVHDSLMFWHKSFGLTVLILTLARLAWRLGHRPPPFDPVMRPWEVRLATFIHWLFYALLIVIPLTGWLLTSANGRPISFFGLFHVPLLPVRGKEAHDMFKEVHEILGKGMIGVIALHVAGALKHHFEGHRHLIGRMAPWAYRAPEGVP
jgi:cytochrome b561